jgi:hypothetical protein
MVNRRVKWEGNDMHRGRWVWLLDDADKIRNFKEEAQA